jgi:hypothetical protein
MLDSLSRRGGRARPVRQYRAARCLRAAGIEWARNAGIRGACNEFRQVSIDRMAPLTLRRLDVAALRRMQQG